MALQSSAADGGVEGEEVGDGLKAGTELDGDGVGELDPHATVNDLVQTFAPGLTTNIGAVIGDSTGAGVATGWGVEAILIGVVGLRTKYTTPIAKMIVRNTPNPISSDFFICAVIVLPPPILDHIH